MLYHTREVIIKMARRQDPQGFCDMTLIELRSFVKNAAKDASTQQAQYDYTLVQTLFDISDNIDRSYNNARRYVPNEVDTQSISQLLKTLKNELRVNPNISAIASCVAVLELQLTRLDDIGFQNLNIRHVRQKQIQQWLHNDDDTVTDPTSDIHSKLDHLQNAVNIAREALSRNPSHQSAVSQQSQPKSQSRPLPQSKPQSKQVFYTQ